MCDLIVLVPDHCLSLNSVSVFLVCKKGSIGSTGMPKIISTAKKLDALSDQILYCGKKTLYSILIRINVSSNIVNTCTRFRKRMQYNFADKNLRAAIKFYHLRNFSNS